MIVFNRDELCAELELEKKEKGEKELEKKEKEDEPSIMVPRGIWLELILNVMLNYDL